MHTPQQQQQQQQQQVHTSRGSRAKMSKNRPHSMCELPRTANTEDIPPSWQTSSDDIDCNNKSKPSLFKRLKGSEAKRAQSLKSSSSSKKDAVVRAAGTWKSDQTGGVKKHL